jgi:hypothetical protein
MGKAMDEELAAMYNYFYKSNLYSVTPLNQEGFYQFNYSPAGVYRKNNWVVTMEPVSIPSYIDDPPHFLLWSADEMAPILLGLVIGIFTGNALVLCLLVPRGHPFWEKERIPLAELRGQRVLLPSLRQDLFSPLWAACARAGFAPNAEIGPSFYQAYYLVQEQLCTCLTRYEPGARRELDRVRDVLLEDLPPLCVSLVQRRDYTSHHLLLHIQLVLML